MPLSVDVPVVSLPYWGTALTITAVPTGIFAPEITTATGFDVVLGSATSGVA